MSGWSIIHSRKKTIWSTITNSKHGDADLGAPDTVGNMKKQPSTPITNFFEKKDSAKAEKRPLSEEEKEQERERVRARTEELDAERDRKRELRELVFNIRQKWGLKFKDWAWGNMRNENL